MKNKPKKRAYKRITPRVVTEHLLAEITEGNATSAVRAIEGERVTDNATVQRAHRIISKRKDVSVSEFIENELERIGGEAIERVATLVHSDDERIATKNAHFVIEHIRGKAVQRSVSLTGRLNIQSVLD